MNTTPKVFPHQPFPLKGRLKPFFCYYGGKWRAAMRYPAPQCDTIIEPFSGGAGYATTYADLRVILYEVDPAIYQLWDYLIRVSPAEIRRLPSHVEHVDDVRAPEAAKSLVGFWLNKGSATPKKSASAWARGGLRPNSYWGDTIKDRIARQVSCIKHWKVVNASFERARNRQATWFIDPPYQGTCGDSYRFRSIDYGTLGEWSRSRKGQVIVCEQAGANWLDFDSLANLKATPGAHGKSDSEEVIWTAPAVAGYSGA